jgi:hypothetical protein
VRRRLLNAATVGSLLLFVATAALWVRSCWRQDTVQFADRRHSLFTTPHAVWSATTDRPYWLATRYQSDPPNPGFLRNFGPIFGYTVRPVTGGASHAALGFVYFDHVQPPPHTCRFTYVGVPLWAPLALSAVMPLEWLWRRRKRATPGACVTCGYDLRATPGRCPECGTEAVRDRGQGDRQDAKAGGGEEGRG